MMKPLLLSVCFTFLAASLTGQNARQYIKAGNEFMKTGNYADAAGQYSKAIELAPDNGDAYVSRANANAQLEKYQEAADDYIRASSFLPKDVDVPLNAGKMFYLLGDDDKALDWFNKALAIRKDNLEVLQYKIRTLFRKGKFEEAGPICESALAYKENAVNLYLAGIVNDKLNDQSKAEFYLDKAISRDKTYLDPRIAISDLRLRMGKTDQAMQDINAALKLDPTSIDAYLCRSRIFVKNLDYPDAINDVSKTILISPNDEKLYLTRGIYYQQFTQHQNAVNDFNKVLLLNGKNAEALYRRASSYEEIANYKSAIRDYEALVGLSEYDARAMKLLDEAKKRLFELNRESDKPVVQLMNPAPDQNGKIDLPRNKTEFSLIARVSDQSEITTIAVNGKPLPGPFTKTGDHYEFISAVPIDTASEFNISATDVYGNTSENVYKVIRTEINPPKITLLAPYASDDRTVFLESGESSLYVEGTINDESLIKSVLIDGVSASYRLNDLNPSFSANLNILNKNQITITATDIHGNVQETVYAINREGAEADNPMGKTWAIFVENSKYQVFASLDGPPKDIVMMKSALSKYKINNIIHKKDMSKKDMERFFAIELRDLLRSNHVNSLLIWYSGHGKFINETGYWIPVDAARDDEFTYYNINALRASMESYSGVTHTLVVTDACESGPTFYQAMRSTPTIKNCNDWQAVKFKSSQVFSSAGYELAVDNSQFTKTFANTLANNPDACIPIELIVNKVTQAVAQNNQQRPQFGKIAGLSDEDGTFFFMVKNPGQ